METALWLLEEFNSSLRCDLCSGPDGRYLLRVTRSQGLLPFLEQEFADRRSAIEVSIALYRGFKDAGWCDGSITLAPAPPRGPT